MPKEFVTLQELARIFNIDKSTVRRYLVKNGFTFLKVRTNETRGQLTLALSKQDAELAIQLRRIHGFMYEK